MDKDNLKKLKNEVKSDLDIYNRLILSAEQDIRDLESRYGTGVRPSWMSAEIVSIGERINYLNGEVNKCEQILKEKENE